jgi:hypothetical protein
VRAPEPLVATELALIAADCEDLVRLILRLQLGEMSPAIGLGLPPFVAWFAGESFKSLASLTSNPSESPLSASLFDVYADAVTKLRARVKLFDDSRGGLDGLIDTFELAQAQSSDWFNHNHRGFLGRIARSLQPDLGVYWSDGRPVVTTHTALLTMGLTKERLAALGPASMETDLATFARSFSEAAGGYIGQLGAFFEASGQLAPPDPTSLTVAEIELTHSDHFADRAYLAVARRLGLPQPQLAIAALFVATQVNYVERVLARLIAADSILLLRARFLTAYHATAATSRLVELAGDRQQDPMAQLRDLLRGPSSEFLLGARRLRNLLAHYGLRDAARFIGAGGSPLEQAIRGTCGRSLEDVSEIAQGQLARISDAFDESMSKTSLRGTRAWLGDHT